MNLRPFEFKHERPCIALMPAQAIKYIIAPFHCIIKTKIQANLALSGKSRGETDAEREQKRQLWQADEKLLGQSKVPALVKQDMERRAAKNSE